MADIMFSGKYGGLGVSDKSTTEYVKITTWYRGWKNFVTSNQASIILHRRDVKLNLENQGEQGEGWASIEDYDPGVCRINKP